MNLHCHEKMHLLLVYVHSFLQIGNSFLQYCFFCPLHCLVQAGRVLYMNRAMLILQPKHLQFQFVGHFSIRTLPKWRMFANSILCELEVWVQYARKYCFINVYRYLFCSHTLSTLTKLVLTECLFTYYGLNHLISPEPTFTELKPKYEQFPYSGAPEKVLGTGREKGHLNVLSIVSSVLSIHYSFRQLITVILAGYCTLLYVLLITWNYVQDRMHFTTF